MRLRQIALAVRDLEAVTRDVTDVLGIEVAYSDPAVGVFGLHNMLLPIGEGFLELLTPTRPDVTGARFLERRGGDAGYMVILQTHDLAADRRRFEACGARIVWETVLAEIATVHLHPRDPGAAIVSFDEAHPWESWHWAGPDWRRHVRTGRVDALLGATLAGRDPGALAARWSEVVGRPCRQLPGGRREISLEDGGHLRFEAATEVAGEGLVAVCLRARSPQAVRDAAAARRLCSRAGEIRLGGVRLELVSAADLRESTGGD